MIKIEVSYGEIVDKLTILEIKRENVLDPEKSKNIENEYMYLLPIVEGEIKMDRESRIYLDLLETNRILWDIEDKIRDKERKKEFDSDFIDLARSVYFTNDKRAQIKKEINLLTGSRLVEEKLYTDY